jgi:hypothetical protein
MPDTPNQNTQFGQKIGVNDTGEPQIDHGTRADQSEMVDDGHGGLKARNVHPMRKRPPAEEASWASEYTKPEDGPPSSDAALPDEAPSVWDASKGTD